MIINDFWFWIFFLFFFGSIILSSVIIVEIKRIYRKCVCVVTKPLHTVSVNARYRVHKKTYDYYFSISGDCNSLLLWIIIVKQKFGLIYGSFNSRTLIRSDHFKLRRSLNQLWVPNFHVSPLCWSSHTNVS